VILPALAGLTAGATHALSGPDHLAAVLPLASEAPERGPLIGLSWGLGHGAGTVLLAVIAMGLRVQLDLDALGSGAEALIGLVLIGTGLWALRRVRRPVRDGHPGAALGIGTLHGVAGGAHVVVVISALALPLESAVGWLVAFVVGAAGAMATVGWLCRQVGVRAPEDWQRRARAVAGALAVAVGVGWLATSVAW
jgi:nickel/cobalt exporter